MKDPKTFRGFRRWLAARLKDYPPAKEVRRWLLYTDYEGPEVIPVDNLWLDRLLIKGPFAQWWEEGGASQAHDWLITELRGDAQTSREIEELLCV